MVPGSRRKWKVFYTDVVSSSLHAEGANSSVLLESGVRCNGNPCGAAITDIDNGANAALSIKTVIYQAASLYGTLGIDADSNGVPDNEESLSTDTNSSSDESESE